VVAVVVVDRDSAFGVVDEVSPAVAGVTPVVEVVSGTVFGVVGESLHDANIATTARSRIG
jgi:hypothetical protein